MIRALVIAAGAATVLGACTVTTVSNDPYYSRGSYYNPPGWVDYNRNGVDDRTERRTTYYSGYQSGYYDRWGNWHSYR